MMYFEVLKRFDQGKSVPLLDPIKDMDIDSKTLVKLIDSKTTIQTQLGQTELKDLNPN